MNHRKNGIFMTARAGLALGVCVLLAPGLAMGQQTEEPQGNSPQSNQERLQSQSVGEEEALPRFSVVAPIIDFGTIPDTEPVTGIIRFRNTGTAVLTVPQPSTTCGCTAAQMPKNEFEPGEWAEVKVTFDPRGKTPGRHEQTVTFRSNDRENPVTAVKVRSIVKPVVSIEPQQVNLGAVAKHTRKETLISITGSMTDFEAFYVTLVGEGSKYFDVEILGTDMVEKDGEPVSRTDLLVSLKHDAPPGRAQAVATIRTNDERRQLLTVPIGAEVVGDVLINPPRMSLGNLSVGNTLEEIIEIRHGRSEPFEITGIELRPLQPSGIASMPIEYTIEPLNPEAKSDGKAQDAYRVKLVMPSMAEAGRIRGNFVVHTNVSLEELVMLPYVGRVVDSRSGE